KQSVSEYSVKFRGLTIKSGFDQYALIEQYQRGMGLKIISTVKLSTTIIINKESIITTIQFTSQTSQTQLLTR
ncbi:hypothetical protein BB560_004911, partial [Smittium megazygosporum]